MFSQIIAIVVMNIRSIPQRFWMSLATVVAVGVVVAVLLAFLAMGNGFKKTLEGSGSSDIAMILRSGSQAEINSVLNREQVNVIESSEGIARDDNGPLISAELYLIVDGKKRGSDSSANLPFRGIDKRGIDLRPKVEIIEGRMFESGKNEIMVGESVVKQYEGFDIGSNIKLGQAQWTVVGVFSTGGSVFDSELWTDVRTLQGQFNRGDSYQIIRAKLASDQGIAAIEETIKSDKRLNLEVHTEKDYYASQTQSINTLIFLGWFLAVAMAWGAIAGALNTMYNSVAQRAGEIATLRALGFPSLPVFLGTLVEALALAVVGGVIGAFAAYLFFDGLTTSTLGSSFTQVVFKFEINPTVILDGVIMALVIGFVGGFFPALRAARMPVLRAFAAAS